VRGGGVGQPLFELRAGLVAVARRQQRETEQPVRGRDEPIGTQHARAGDSLSRGSHGARHVTRRQADEHPAERHLRGLGPVARRRTERR
jgi:hypothetical protein